MLGLDGAAQSLPMRTLGLIVGLLTFLNVDYVGFARRAVGLGAPYDLGRRMEAQANGDRCAQPGAMLAPGQDAIEAKDKKDDEVVLAMSTQDGATSVVTGSGLAGTVRQPVRGVVLSGGRGSMAAVEVFFPQVYGGRLLVVGIEAALLFAYLFLAIQSAREHPN